MTKRPCRLCLSIFTSLLLLTNVALACGYGPGVMGYYRFFEPDGRQRPHFVGFPHYSHQEKDNWADGWYNSADPGPQRRLQALANIASWEYHLKGAVSRGELCETIYGPAYCKEIGIGDGRAAKADGKWPQGAMEYLDYAHACEPLCNGSDGWDNKPSPSPSRVEQLVAEGKKLYENTPSAFLRLRYAYQMMRLLQYQDRHAEAIAVFQTHATPVLGASREMAGWAWGHYAGCLRAKKRVVESAYAFSRQYALSPSRGLQARWGWRIDTDAQWTALMARCKDDAERADNHALRAFSLHGRPLGDMQAMQRLDPGRADVELLLLREINKLEMEYLGPKGFEERSFEAQLRHPQVRDWVKRDLGELSDFVAQSLADSATHDRAIWEMAHAYLRFIGGDLEGGRSEMQALLPKYHGEDLLKARQLDMTMEVIAAPRVTSDMERRYTRARIETMGWDSTFKERFIELRDDAFYWKYIAQGDTLMATLTRYSKELMQRFGIQSAFFEDLLALTEKTDKTPLEEELLVRLATGEEPDNWDGRYYSAVTRGQIHEWMATAYLAEGDLDRAVALMPDVTNKDSWGNANDPFAPYIGWESTGAIHYPARQYSRLEFARSLRSLKQAAQRKDSLQAHRYLLLGNAYFNTLHSHAASWYLCHEDWSGWHFGYEKAFLREYTVQGHKGMLWPRNIDTGKARGYYAQCIASTDDPELQALACYMLARCDRTDNQWVTKIEVENFKARKARPAYDYDNNRRWEDWWKAYEKVLETYRGRETDIAHFALLRDRYADTEVAQMLLRECPTFERYCAD